MVSAFSGYFVSSAGFGTIPAMIVAIATGIVVSIAIELLAYRPMRKRNAKRLFLMISAMGVNIFLTNLYLSMFGANLRTLSSGFISNTVTILNVQIGTVDIAAFLTSVVALAIISFFFIRQDQELLCVLALLMYLPLVSWV